MSDEILTALDQCLRQLANGVSVETVLRRYPALADDLRPLLEVAHSLSRNLAVPRGAQLASRARFLNQAAGLRPARPGLRFLPRALGTALTFVLGFVAGTYGVVAASAQSLPGDQLYPLKRAAESAQILIAPTAGRSQLEQQFATERVQEIEAVATQGRTAAVEFEGQLQRMEGQRWQVAGLSVVVSEETHVVGAPAVGDFLRVAGGTQSDGAVHAETIVVLTPSATPRPTAVPPATATATRAPTAHAPEAEAEIHEASRTTEPPEQPERSETPKPEEVAPTSEAEGDSQPENTSEAESTDDHDDDSGPSPSNTPDS